MKHIWHKLGVIMLGGMLASHVLAKPLPLLEQPNSNSKSIGSIDLAAGIIPIFTSSDGKWMKIGDPKNGNVGWVKASDLKEANGPVSITYTQQYMDNGKGPEAFQFIQYGPPKKMSKEEAQALLQKIQLEQWQVQRSLQHMFNDMFEQFNHHWPMMDASSPILMPIVIMPNDNKEAPKQPSADPKK